MRALAVAVALVVLGLVPLACYPWPECWIEDDCVAYGDHNYRDCQRWHYEDGGIIDETSWPKCVNNRCIHICWGACGYEDGGGCPR